MARLSGQVSLLERVPLGPTLLDGNMYFEGLLLNIINQLLYRPVRMHMDLQTNMNSIGKRCPYYAKYSVSCCFCRYIIIILFGCGFIVLG